MNILLLEPNYESKYPPLGLMKMAYYHKECRGDFIWLAKGKAPQSVSDSIRRKLARSKYYTTRYDIDEFAAQAEEVTQNRRWDRVYVTTLFTYEWAKTVVAIEYAKTLVDDVSKPLFSEQNPKDQERRPSQHKVIIPAAQAAKQQQFY